MNKKPKQQKKHWHAIKLKQIKLTSEGRPAM